MTLPWTRLKTSGFSLAETMMQLMILTAVTIPMVMLLNVQKNNISQTQQTTTDKIQAQQLFDHVVVQDPNPIADYTVNTYPSALCDPALATLPASCTTNPITAPGPYFTRTVKYLPDINANGTYGKQDQANGGLLVTVNLYHGSGVNVNNAVQTPYYTATRTYQLDAYRIQVGALNGTLTWDNSGNSWFPDTLVTATTNSGTPTWTVVSPNATFSCPTPAVPTTTPNTSEAPFNNYCMISTKYEPTYTFSVMPNKTYDVNLYFVQPSAANVSGCLSSVTNASCFLADINLSTNMGALNSYLNFDLNAATGMSVTSSSNNFSIPMGYVLHSTIQTQPGTSSLNVQILPSASCTKGDTCTTYLSGVEVLRRDIQ